MTFAKKLGWTLSTVAVAGFVLTGCGSSGGNGTANGSSSNDKNVTIGYTNWAEDVAVTELWKQVLTKKGYNVTTTELQNGEVFQSMAQGGTNSVNVDFDVWLPVTDATYQQRFGSDFTDLGQWYQGPVKIGLVVPKYVYDSGIHSIADLNAHASEFNNQIVGIDPGSGEMNTLKSKVVPGYGLKLNVVDGSSASMLAALQRAENSKKPVVVTLWSPHWAFTKWQLQYLQDPKGLMGQSEHIQADANKQWASSHPTLVKWFGNFKLTKQQLGQLELDINKDGNQKGTQEWISNNQSLVDSWTK